MSWGARRSERIAFQRGIEARMIGIDGTWNRACKLLDISETGGRLVVEQSIEGLTLKEFFLMLSSNGHVWRRCELIRVNGEEFGVRFLKAADKPKTKNARGLDGAS